MNGNQHAQFATEALDTADKLVASGDIYARDGAMLAISAQSTLALAFEQRTANLIAMATAKYADGSAMFASLMGPSGEGLVSEIKERMGL